jgi:hypothetical protein
VVLITPIMCAADYRLEREDKSMSEEIPETTSEELSAEEIRLRERRSFDAFNEAQAQRRKISREQSAIRDAGENRRWEKREVGGGGDAEMAENDSPGG